MLKARVIPCLDVKDGRVVKGVNFVNLVDAGDPVAQAKFYDAEGADELCFLDITASSDDRATLYDVVRRTAEQCFMPLTVGGGVREVERRDLGGLGPALDRDLAATRVDADGDGAGKRAAGVAHQLRIFHCGGAENDPADAALEPALDRGRVANAAAELHGDRHRPQNRLDRGTVGGLSRDGAVEIDHVKPTEALALERARLRRGIVVEDGRGAHVSLEEAHALAALEIDRGVDDHGSAFRLAVSGFQRKWPLRIFPSTRA